MDWVGNSRKEKLEMLQGIGTAGRSLGSKGAVVPMMMMMMMMMIMIYKM